MEEESSNGKRKVGPWIPPNYISIFELKQRWNKEKERKQKEEEKRRVEEEDDLKKGELKKSRNSKEKESKEVIVNDDGLPKKNHDVVVAVEEDNVEECGSVVTEIDAEGNGPRDDVMVIETKVEDVVWKKKNTRRHRKKKDQDVVEFGNKTPVKDVVRVYREKAKRDGSCEEAVAGIETQFEKLSVKPKDCKRETRPKQKGNLGSQRVRMDAAAMVWVRKRENERDGDGSGSGVKT